MKLILVSKFVNFISILRRVIYKINNFNVLNVSGNISNLTVPRKLKVIVSVSIREIGRMSHWVVSTL